MDPDGSTPVPENLRFGAIGSTNDLMLRLAQDNLDEHTSLLTREQTEARAGTNRIHAPPGGLWLSTYWEPEIEIDAAARLPLAALWGLREGVRDATGVEAGLKWPNDLLVDDKRLGCVMVHTRVGPSTIDQAAIGVALNVNNPVQALPGSLQERAVSLQDILSRDVDLDALAASVHTALSEAYALVTRGEELARVFESCWTQKGRELTLTEGYQPFSGTAAHVDAKGRLVLEDGDESCVVDDPQLAKVTRIVGSSGVST